ncbi:hypothetical protein BDA96_06G225300 [Sorghum bicolor]|uniref:Uncharacterized protein n=2 Tax=Sorghum bicolor TaxID=4558 RepID=A0A921UDB4_SORBI|nr:uncharacterized protein LOC8063933 [Sorghum bicolor]EES11386.1 hypothetical protein SORBI_3006G206200 [Sorghum bicolor]KAG0527338.1 hypothetical protein BDA96_06G225300 [Sorghum bicolor]|eukprot:XP_002447058.1 uncharacterized protein LOC8063933 [Sorghum bicolor]
MAIFERIEGEAEDEEKAATGEEVVTQVESAIGPGGDRVRQPTGRATMGVSATGPPQGTGSQPPLDGQGASSEYLTASPTLRGSVLPSKLNLKRVSAPPSDESETIPLKNSVDAATSTEGVTQGENRGQHLTKHAPGCITVTGVTQGTVSQNLVDGHEKSEGPTKSPRPHCSLYTDEDIERMKRRIEELELLNADLKQRLEEAKLQLKFNDAITHPKNEIPDGLNICHGIFICSNESGYEKLEKKLAHADSKIIHVVSVHGRTIWLNVRRSRYGRQARKKDRSSPEFDFRRLTPLGKIILLGIIEDIYRLHRRGFCLDGRFTLQSFYWTDEKKIKLDPSLKLIAVSTEGRKSCMINDYHRIHEIIMQILLLCKETASEDLEQLLDLLKCTDPVDVEDIIRYNVSLMTEIAKRSHFITLYDRWRQMEAQEQEMEEGKGKPTEAEGSETKIPNSKKVLKFIPTSSINSDGSVEDWSNFVYLNDHVKLVYDRRCQKTGYGKLYGAKELLVVWQNALTHILEDSLAEGKLEFYDEDVVNMLEFVLPGVFNLFQKGMHSIGHEELPHLMRIMRM